jgi:hypothetical protein
MQPSLGRIVSPTDFRDHQFLARAIAPRPEPGVVRRRWWTPDPWDQGQPPECVAFSSLLWLNAGPVRNKSANASGADAYYAMCQQIDGWPLPHGRAWLSFTALAALLAEDGEASMANEIVRPVAKAA